MSGTVTYTPKTVSSHITGPSPRRAARRSRSARRRTTERDRRHHERHHPVGAGEVGRGRHQPGAGEDQQRTDDLGIRRVRRQLVGGGDGQQPPQQLDRHVHEVLEPQPAVERQQRAQHPGRSDQAPGRPAGPTPRHHGPTGEGHHRQQRPPRPPTALELAEVEERGERAHGARRTDPGSGGHAPLRKSPRLATFGESFPCVQPQRASTMTPCCWAAGGPVYEAMRAYSGVRDRNRFGI